jgi:hypothetical protein
MKVRAGWPLSALDDGRDGMRSMRAVTDKGADWVSELPPQFALIERRRAGLAEAAWNAAGRGWVPGFDAYSLVVADPGGEARLVRVGLAVTETFGLVADMGLERGHALNTELCAACDLVALETAPVHFEANLTTPQSACVLLRGVALPLADEQHVQIVLSWREVLNRTATARLRRDFIAALRKTRPVSVDSDPFSPDFQQKSGA